MRFEFSAGGVVVKRENRKNHVLVCQHSQHHGWVFPKGLIDNKPQTSKKETKEEAALREVREETGATGEIIKELPSISYWYVMEGEKIKKTVYYFLMNYVSGDIKNHDEEMEAVEWLPIDEIATRLTYKSDKEVWGEANKILKRKAQK